MPWHRHAETAWQINAPKASHGLGIREGCLLKFHKLYNHKEPRRNYQGLCLSGRASAKLSYVGSFLVKGKHDFTDVGRGMALVTPWTGSWGKSGSPVEDMSPMLQRHQGSPPGSGPWDFPPPFCTAHYYGFRHFSENLHSTVLAT